MPTVKKRVPLFWIFLLLLALACAAGVFFALDRLWIELAAYQAKYDAALPETAIAEYLRRIEYREFDKILEESGFQEDEWNVPADYISWLRRLYGSDPTAYEYRPEQGGGDSGEAGKPWAVLDGGNLIATVYLGQFTDENGETRWTVRTPAVYKEGYTVAAPEYAVVFLNAAALPPETSVGNTPVESFLSLTDETEPPKILQYKTPRLLGESVFSAMGQNGEVCLIDENRVARTVAVTVEPYDEDLEIYTELMEQAATSYAEFISKDGQLAAFLKNVYPKSTFYESVRTFDNSWYITHNSHSFENWKFENVARCSETSFAGDVSFDYVVMQGSKEHRFPSAYHMSFMEIGGDYILVNLEVK